MPHVFDRLSSAWQLTDNVENLRQLTYPQETLSFFHGLERKKKVNQKRRSIERQRKKESKEQRMLSFTAKIRTLYFSNKFRYIKKCGKKIWKIGALSVSDVVRKIGG